MRPVPKRKAANKPLDNLDYNGALAEWLCSGLQIREPRFDSGRRLHLLLVSGMKELKITASAVITDGVNPL